MDENRPITPLTVFPLVWISSVLMSPRASLHCKQLAAKQRDSSLLMLLNRILLSDGLIELGFLQIHTHTSTHKNAHLGWWEPVEMLVACAEGQRDFWKLHLCKCSALWDMWEQSTWLESWLKYQYARASRQPSKHWVIKLTHMHLCTCFYLEQPICFWHIFKDL